MAVVLCFNLPTLASGIMIGILLSIVFFALNGFKL